MARKRMFDSEIINQDSFLDLPMEAKALYFLLGMEADDEGFVSPKKVLRLHGGSNDSLKILVAKQFVIPFNTGVVVITDWKRNNYLNKNKLKETIYQEEKKQLTFNQVTERYELIEVSNTNGLTKVKTEFNNSLTSIEENRVVESSIEENSSSSVKNNLYNSEVEKLQQTIIETIGNTNINNIKECIDYLEKLPIELIEYALRKTARIERPSWQYTIPILESYISKKFKSIEEVKADDLKHKSKNNYTLQEETNKTQQKIQYEEIEYENEEDYKKKILEKG